MKGPKSYDRDKTKSETVGVFIFRADKNPKEMKLDELFGYKALDDELLIYGLGSNQKDDGGRGTYKIDKMVMDKDDDWAWREKMEIPGKK